MSIRNTYPTIRPSLSLNFARSRTLDPRITFSRTTTGTYMDADGLIKVASADEARFDHSYDPVSGSVRSLGLLVEERRQNLLTGSDDFGPLYWVKLNSVGVSTNVTTSPDGTINADKFVENTDTSHKVLARSFTLTASTTYTFSIFVKSAERSNILIHLRKSDYSTRFGGFFNLTTKTFTGEVAAGGTLVSSSIIEYPNNWFRLTITGDIGANTAAVTTLYLMDTNNNIGYTGNGTSGVFVWGAQLEQGSFPTSYIPTTNSTVTRTPDNVSMTGDNFSSWYNSTEGTVFVDCTPVYNNSTNQYRRLLSIHNNSGAQTDVIQFIQSEQSNQVQCAVWDGASFQSGFVKVVTSGTRYKVAFAVKENNMNASYDGSISTDDTTCTLPVMTEMDIGSYNTFSSLQATMHINKISYYPRRLTNSQLITLTR